MSWRVERDPHVSWVQWRVAEGRLEVSACGSRVWTTRPSHPMLNIWLETPDRLVVWTALALNPTL